MALTAAEQYELELINRARLDPEAEAARYGIDLNEGLAAGSISSTAKQVLAPNAQLEAAAQGHSEWMLATDTFSHTGTGGSSAGDRMASAGYAFTGSWGWAENLGVLLTTGQVDLEAAIEEHHGGLFLSESHRVNTMNDRMREIGIAQVQGQFTQGGVTYNASMLTQKFAYSGGSVFVTGVAYADADNDAFYGIGEGLGGIGFSASASGDISDAAGGYSVGVSPAGTVTASITQGSTTLATLALDMSTGNGKLDLVLGADDAWRLDLSTSATLISGVANAALLGVADLSLTGHSGANLLTGNKGHNTISGAGGNDSLSGGDGSDVLDGGSGADVLDGGLGNDHYVVENGADRVQPEARYAAGGGIDTVESSVSFYLAPNTEYLVLTGSADISGTGRAAQEALIGNSGNNQLSGRGGNDGLNGGSGDDRMIGGDGRDWMMGGAGADDFVFRSTDQSGFGWAARDLIDGFDHGADVINLYMIDANTLTSGNQAFDFIGSTDFTGQGAASAGELRADARRGGDAVLLEMDSNGDGWADMQIMVLGTNTMSAGDFFL